MEIPNELIDKLEEIILNKDLNDIKKRVEEVSLNYRDKARDNNKLIVSNEDAIAYALYRMPATYAAIYTALKHVFEIYEGNIKSVIDIGTGTGAGIWAIKEWLPDAEIKCIEKDYNMLDICFKLLGDKVNNIERIDADILNNKLDVKADLVMSAYMLNEIAEKDRVSIIEKMWNATSDILLLIDIGTKNGHSGIMQVKEWLMRRGANIIAPCTHKGKCMLDKDDWCHCTCRIGRTKIHKYLKEGTLGYEDEKFSYIAVSKNPIKCAKARILRHPIIEKGYTKLKVCKENEIEEVTITKKDKELYKVCKKLNCGDIVDV